VPAEDRLQIEFAKAIQQFIGVGGTMVTPGRREWVKTTVGFFLSSRAGNRRATEVAG